MSGVSDNVAFSADELNIYFSSAADPPDLTEVCVAATLGKITSNATC
jgi:hypothetical protein